MGNCVEIRISVRRYKLWMSYRLYSLYNTLQHTEIMDATHYSFLHIALDVVQTLFLIQHTATHRNYGCNTLQLSAYCSRCRTDFLHIAVCCSVLQCVAVCCSVLQCVAVC